MKEDGLRKKCDLPFTGDRCKNYENHVLKFRTGFCVQGQCEGTKPRSWSGKPMLTCKFFTTCPCKCHDDLDLLFRMADKERVLVLNPEYRTPEREFWMPSDDWDEVHPIVSNSHDIPSPVRVESPAPDLVPATVVRTFTPTPTGRAARGELEAWVKIKCDEWIIEDYNWILCTPAWLADEIAHDQGIKAPSVGAISAIFDRWIKLGFALIAKKPTRFLAYTDDGKKLGLEGLKARAKRTRDIARGEQKRGIRR